ncbi:MAG: prepilin-type N-terminal cleavage/methylation domain-containing protein [Kiritimatiellaeota bacterium]|nr:prepilin-type N-terminal cleavage/methylation domain-containing protein [Kiritimatiellota bacterium]
MKKNYKGFTLVELMVVVAVIAVLSGLTFRLMSAAALAKRRAETIARMEKLQNALSGFYAEYGMYPPVTFEADILDNDGKNVADTSDGWPNHVSRAQPMCFQYPYQWEVRNDVQRYLKEAGIDADEANLVKDSLKLNSDSRNDNRTFCFGLLSFLLPRVELVTYTGMDGRGDAGIHEDFYNSKLWRVNSRGMEGSDRLNTASLRTALTKQRGLENAACAKWLPNLRDLVDISSGGGSTLLGVRITPHGWGGGGPTIVGSGGKRIAIQSATVKDGWGNEFFYYSPPPHQSYRLWSAGPDGRTYPPWIPPEQYKSMSHGENKIRKWVADDLVAGSTRGQ